MPVMQLANTGNMTVSEIIRSVTDVSDVTVTKVTLEGDKALIYYTENDHPSARYEDCDETLAMIHRIFDALDDIYAERERVRERKIRRFE